MNGLRNELAKMRRLTVGTTAAAMALAGIALALLATVTNPAGAAWDVLLANLSLAVALTAPLLLAVMASRLVDIEHQGGGWLSAQTSGVGRGRLCRTKWVALAVLAVVAVAATFGGVLLAGALLGAPGLPDPGRWLRQAAAVAVIDLVVLALHVLVSAYLTNQLVGLGLGVLGTVFAANAIGLPPLVRVWLPWGHYAASAGAGYEHGALVPLRQDLVPTLLLATVTAVAFVVLTRRLDLQEA